MQAQCADPDVTITSDCGTQFDLCLDEYAIGMDEGVKLEVFINDDLGIFDPCETDTMSGTSHGSLTMLPDCNWFYQPDPGFIGQDTFYYILNYLDTCITDCYCYYNGCPDEGRIWTIDALYLGPDGSDNSSYNPTILVKDKEGTTFSTHENLSTGDQFFADGSALHQSTTEYEYQLYFEGDTSQEPDQIEHVHVSCSQEVFGLTFGFLRPISGCIAPTSEKLTCAGVGDTFTDGDELEAESREAGEMVTVATADTTMVVISIEPTLPVELLEFVVKKKEDKNLISWIFNSSTAESIELQKSYDAEDYKTIKTYFTTNYYQQSTYEDYDLQQIAYYRLAFYDQNGSVEYSEVRSVTRENKKADQVRIYPNPIRNELNIEFPADTKLQSIIVRNTNGQIIIQERINRSANNTTFILGNEITEGLFLVEIIADDFHSIKKVLKL